MQMFSSSFIKIAPTFALFIANSAVIRFFSIKLILVTFMATLMLVDTCITVCSIINLQNRISDLVEIENMKWENLITKIEGIPADYQAVIRTYKEKAYKVTSPVTKRLLSAFPEMTLLSKSRQMVFDRLKRNRPEEENDMN